MAFEADSTAETTAKEANGGTLPTYPELCVSEDKCDVYDDNGAGIVCGAKTLAATFIATIAIAATIWIWK